METKEKTEIVQVKKNEEEMEIDLFELMLYYKSRLVFVIGGFLIGAILMALVTIYLVAPKYTATAKLYWIWELPYLRIMKSCFVFVRFWKK